MIDRPTKIPGPDHPIEIQPNASRVVVTVGGRVIADTLEALTLSEAGYAAVQYIPRRDVDMAALARSDHTTYCPYKGEASYFSIPMAGSVRRMRCGRTRRPSQRWRRSRITSPSTLSGSTRSGPSSIGSTPNIAGRPRFAQPTALSP